MPQVVPERAVELERLLGPPPAGRDISARERHVGGSAESSCTGGRRALGGAESQLETQTLTIAQAAAPTATLTGVLIVFGIAVVVVMPALGLLFALAQRNLVEKSSAEDQTSIGL